MDVTLADEDAYSTFVEVAANVEVGDNFNFDLWQRDNSLTKYFHYIFLWQNSSTLRSVVPLAMFFLQEWLCTAVNLAVLLTFDSFVSNLNSEAQIRNKGKLWEIVGKVEFSISGSSKDSLNVGCWLRQWLARTFKNAEGEKKEDKRFISFLSN